MSAISERRSVASEKPGSIRDEEDCSDFFPLHLNIEKDREGREVFCLLLVLYPNQKSFSKQFVHLLKTTSEVDTICGETTQCFTTRDCET